MATNRRGFLGSLAAVITAPTLISKETPTRERVIELRDEAGNVVAYAHTGFKTQAELCQEHGYEWKEVLRQRVRELGAR